jgi:cupin 2 domain-containing protein
MNAKNIFESIPPELAEELFTTIHRAANFRIERIVSQGQSSPEGFWFDQDEHEWIIVLSGSATVAFADEDEPVQLAPGSYLNIPAHKKHRVEQTSRIQQTVWLAIHYSD